MKQQFIIFLLATMSLSCNAQALHIFHDGKPTPDVVANGGVDSIYFAPKFFGSNEYQWVFETQDGMKKYDVIDSISFNLNHLVAARHIYYVPTPAWPGYLEIRYSWNFNYWDQHLGEDDWYYPFLFDEDGKIVDFAGWGSSTKSGSHIESRSIYEDEFRQLSYPTTFYLMYRSVMNDILFKGMSDSIKIVYTGSPIINNLYYNICFSSEETDYVIDLDTVFSKPEIEFVQEPRWSFLSDRYINEKLTSVYESDNDFNWSLNQNGKPLIHLSKNETGKKRCFPFILSAGGFVTYGEFYQMRKPFIHTPEENIATLREFCDSTNFNNWKNKANWFTEKPLWEWEGINKDYNSRTNHYYYFWNFSDRVVSLSHTYDDGLCGQIPESFTILLDDIDDVNSYLDFRNCALYGKVPYNLRHHENWPKFGWYFLPQNAWYGGGLDLDEDSNLRMKDEEVMFADGTKSTAYEELAKHRLTLVAVGGPSEAMCNLCLAYANKGFHYIYAAQDWLGGTQEEAQRSAYLYKNVPNVSVYYRSWANGNLSDGLSALGSTFLLDSEGNVIDYAPMDWGLGEELYTNRLGKHLLNILGEPEEHEPYVPYEKEYYTSSDYSHDGEVVTLQKATVGRGIDLVFMGDQYVDTLLVDGGKYEEDMRTGMEYFFGVEPYKSLRERFNVYTVKAVSPNGNDGPVHKFNMQNDIVFEYVRKIPDVDMNNVAITVIHNAPNGFFVSGETGMWESGASIAWIEQGGPSSIICHEAGGHGFAKLLDEYVYSGYESNHTQEGYNEEFREWIKTAYHDKGWGMNVSATDNPDEVPWNRFLKDERFQDEIGIYKGAWFWPEELWRPSENSVMNNDYSWFNAPSREAIYKRVMQLSEGEDWTYDYETFVAFDAPIREAYKNARAGSRLNGSNGQNVQQRRVELRPPTIHKGSWRDADKQENVDDGIDKFVKATNIVRMASKSNEENVNGEPRHYVMYKGERIDAEDFYRNRNKYK